jgi:hypothetical protein
MAHANIRISDEVLAAWHAAHDEAAAPLRYMSVEVDVDNATVTLRRTGAHPAPEEAGADGAGGATADWFAAMVEADGGAAELATSPRLWLVSLEPSRRAGSQWGLVSYIPEAAMLKPRVKMMYAAARDDVKRALEASRFVPDYHATEPSELTLPAYTSWRRRDSGEAMSEAERRKAEDNSRAGLSRGALGRAASAMAAVPFSLSDAVREALLALHGVAPPSPAGEFGSGVADAEAEGGATPASSPVASPGDAGMGWAHVRINRETEQLHVAATGPATDAEAQVASLPEDEPTFLILRLPAAAAAAAGEAAGALPATPPPTPVAGAGAGCAGFAAAPTVFVYHCPQGAHPKLRMLYSTAKQRLVEGAAATPGVKFSRVIEVTDRADLLEQLAEMAAAAAKAAAAGDAAAGASGLRSPGGSSSAAGGADDLAGVDASFAKPGRAGRGRARILRP